MNFLNKVVQTTLKHYQKKNQKLNLPSFKKKNQKLYNSLLQSFLVIAECKKASPSKGLIKPKYSIAKIAKSYYQGGAKAISVLTEKKYFLGSFLHIKKVQAKVNLPILCKDFILTEYQILKASQAGAKLVLLIIKILTVQRYLELAELISRLGMVPLVEIFNFSEFKIAQQFKGNYILGINNRNLKTLKTDLTHSFKIKKKIERLNSSVPIISESGIKTPQNVKQLKKKGFAGILIGEHLLLQKNPKQALKELLED